MIVKREKYYVKYLGKYAYKMSKQFIKRTSYWLFGIIPLYIKNEVQDGEYER